MASKKNKLDVQQLRPICDPTGLDTKASVNVELPYSIIGQEKAREALDFGLRMNKKGYNIFLTGVDGQWKTNYALSILQKAANQQNKPPSDWCYVHNFMDENQPIAIELPNGMGKIFKEKMEDFIDEVIDQIPDIFETEEYLESINQFKAKYEVVVAQAIEKAQNLANSLGMSLKLEGTNYSLIPIINGNPVTVEEYNAMSETEIAQFRENVNKIIPELEKLACIRSTAEKEQAAQLEDFCEDTVFEYLNLKVTKLKEQFSGIPLVLDFLDNVVIDITENLDELLYDDSEAKSEYAVLIAKSAYEKRLKYYEVNVVVDNSETKLTPVVFCQNPTFTNLIGKVEYKILAETYSYNHTQIRCGDIHKANGGFLVIRVSDLFSNISTWDILKRVLITGVVPIEDIYEQLGYGSKINLKPQPIPLSNFKLVLIGDSYYYDILYNYDEDFRELFKVKVDLESVVPRNSSTIGQLCRFISQYCKENQYPMFNAEGMAAVVDYSSRLAEHQEKLTSNLDDIKLIIDEAVYWQKSMNQASAVSREAVETAIRQRTNRANKYYESYMKYFEDGILLVDTSGAAVGEINGLCVIDSGDFSFGIPSKITVITSVGQEGIVSIERKISMSGASHSKGVLILEGYLRNKYAQDIPLALSASICFEQNYGGIDGDSASSTELYCILSSLAELPINQGIAVTGSVNQKGRIQPIGGVNQKIEGFFRLCKSKGFTGDQGVIIPHQNVKDLCLSSELIEAVEAGQFSIYAVETIDEGIEILTGAKVGEKLPNGKYPKGSINYLVEQKLKKFAQISKFGSYKKASAWSDFKESISSKIAALIKKTN